MTKCTPTCDAEKAVLVAALIEPINDAKGRPMLLGCMSCRNLWKKDGPAKHGHGCVVASTSPAAAALLAQAKQAGDLQRQLDKVDEALPPWKRMGWERIDAIEALKATSQERAQLLADLREARAALALGEEKAT